MVDSGQTPERRVLEDYGAGHLTRREALRRLAVVGVGLPSASALLAACGDDGGNGTTATPGDPTSASAQATSSTGAASGSSSTSTSGVPPRVGPPNVLLIVVDDMRYDHLDFMPNAQRLIQEPGRTFTQARVNVPLCQPARVGFLTGQMSKHNNEVQIGFKGTSLEDHDNCIGKWMNDAGYRCAFLGKYVNFIDGYLGMDAPAGYESWRELMKETSAYEFLVRSDDDGVDTVVGQYSSDYLAEQARAFIDGGGPFLCIVTPVQAHQPFRPRTDLADKWSDLDWPIRDELDVSDKPSWIQALEPLTEADRETIRVEVRGALRELSAVDDMVKQIVESMEPSVLANTIVMLTSDNGVHHGEHRRRGGGTKSGPYEPGLHLPLIVRGPGFEPGPDITSPSLAFQDLNATMLKVAGASAGLPHQLGVPLVDMVADPDSFAQRILLHEIGEGFEKQTGDGITTGPEHPLGFRKLYRYPSIRENSTGPFVYEAYDLDVDPDEWSNWANDESRLAEREALEAELDALLA